MYSRIIATTLLVIPLCSGLSPKSAWSDELSQTIVLCEANPNCQHGAIDRSGRVNFSVRRNDMVVRFQCEQDGDCEFVQPKGKHTEVRNVTAFLSAK